ncbi:hypothetical protein [Faecalitalea cylindroides]|uniref:hypothetical protein n=1 Tax=Faecalitalea cylindroides TaxID=39483 RepID=UPI00267596B1|nr:hypothetical protein [Faecalitalea cylindroides]
MKKRIWNKVVSIFTAILLVVGIVPNTTITALAAGEDAPNTLYVGDQQVISIDNVITYWITSTDGKLTKSPDDQSWNVKYDPSTATLTLKDAKISGSYNEYDNPFTAGIYATGNSNQPVALTIELIGENTITGNYGIFLNAEISASSYGTNATLTITGENKGSLEVSGSSHGIFVKSGTGNASLNIEKATVTSSTNGGYAAGVNVQSSANATGSPNISLSVNGGSLTASGTGNSDGILFYVGSLQATGATTSLTVSENAIVDARNGGISASRILETLPTPTPMGNNSSGIVFDGSTGTVYGDVTLDERLTINQGETLTIPEGSTLNSNGNLTNNGTIVNTGGTLNGEPGGTIISAPTITSQPISQTVEEGDPATFTITASGNDLQYRWQKSADNGISWIEADGAATEATYAIEAATTGMNGLQYRCVVWNDAGSVNSDAATLTVDAHNHSLKHYEYKAPTCTENGNEEYWYCESCKQYFSDENATMPIAQEDTVIAATGHAYGEPTWEWSKDGQSATATFICDNDESHQESKEASITSAVKEEATCTEDGITVYTATVEFNGQTYTDTKEIADLPATGHQLTKVDGKVQTIEETGNITYWYCEVCDKYFSDEKAEHEITLEDTIIAKLPKFVSGANQEWTKGSKDGLTFKIDTDIKEFKKVLVDGKELKDTDYDIKSGSTILTLKPSFLDTLSAGKHKIRFEFNTGSVEAYFTVKDKENSSQTESANTGVQNKYGLWIVLLLVAAGGLAVFGILSKRRKNHK